MIYNVSLEGEARTLSLAADHDIKSNSNRQQQQHQTSKQNTPQPMDELAARVVGVSVQGRGKVKGTYIKVHNNYSIG